MRILFAGHSLAAPLGGGELSARTLLAGLAQGHDVAAFCAGHEARQYDIADAVHCRDVAVKPAPAWWPMHIAIMRTEAAFQPVLTREVSARAPDLLLLQQPACPNPDELPAHTKLVVFLRSLACYGVGDPNPTPWKRAAGRPFRQLRWARTQTLLRRADLVVTNSRFMQTAVERRTGLRSEVVPPFVDTAGGGQDVPTSERRCLTFVGLDGWKGADMAIRLAEALPDREFLFLEGGRSNPRLVSRARRLPNVSCEGWTGDMRQVWARTRILLMPSAWDEPFGRLPVEAGACGIPTIASARGGLAESVGPGGWIVERPDDVAEWLAAIRGLDVPARHAAIAEAARTHAASLDVRITLPRLADVMRQALRMELTP